MMQTDSTQFVAIFENGVLRPLGAIVLPEHEKLQVTVSRYTDQLSDILDWDAHELAEREGDERISLEDVQQALANIPGSMAAIVISERNER